MFPKKKFPKDIHHLIVWRHDSKKGTFQEFEHIFADLGLLLNYNTEITHNTMMEIVHNTKKIFWHKFSPKFFAILAL